LTQKLLRKWPRGLDQELLAKLELILIKLLEYPQPGLYIAVSQAGATKVFAHQLAGERGQIQNSAVLLGVGHLWDEIAG